MATTEKAKKAAKPKKGSKGKKKTKKNTSMNFFSKIMMTLLFISIITIAVFLVAGNFKKDDNDKPKTELSFESKKKSKVDKEPKTETKVEAKEETSVKETQKENEKKETKKENIKEEPKKETKKENIKEEPKKESAKTETEVKKQETKTQKSESKSKTLSGSWLSSEQGASLTLDEYGYRIDFFGVDASKPMTGNYTIEKNLIVFTSDDEDCKVSGTYRIKFYKENFSLIAKDDECTQRRNILEADWEWIEI